MSLIVSNGTAEGTIIYQYTPSETTGLAFVGLFGLATLALIVLSISFRTAYFVPMVIGGIMEASGYYGRAWSHSNTKDLKPYVLYLLLTLAAPPFLAATIYMALARIMVALQAAQFSPIGTRWLTTIFVMVDIIAFIAFLGGAGMQVAASETLPIIGTKLVVAGLTFQIICLAAFVWIAAIFHRRYSQAAATAGCPTIKWRKYFWAMYAACVLMFVRNVFRLCEYTQGHEGVIAHNEWFIYVFDAGTLWFVMVIYVAVHPGWLARKVRLAERSKGSHDTLQLVSTSGQRRDTAPEGPWS